MDVLSVSHNGQLVSFSAGMMAYGFWSDMNLFSQDFAWLGSRRYNAAMIRTLISHRLDVSIGYDIRKSIPISEVSSFQGIKYTNIVFETTKYHISGVK